MGWKGGALSFLIMKIAMMLNYGVYSFFLTLDDISANKHRLCSTFSPKVHLVVTIKSF